MPRILTRHRTWWALLTSVAVLAVAAPAVALEGSKTSDAQIDAVPRLRAQLDDQAEARVNRPTTPAQIDAVPRLREQLAKQAETAPAASDTVGFQWGDAAIGAGSVIGVLAVAAGAAVAANSLRRRQRQSPGLG